MKRLHRPPGTFTRYYIAAPHYLSLPRVSTAQPPADHPRLGVGLGGGVPDQERAPGVPLTRVPPRGPRTQHVARDELASVHLQTGN